VGAEEWGSCLDYSALAKREGRGSERGSRTGNDPTGRKRLVVKKRGVPKMTTVGMMIDLQKKS
jgi:hypothetical protein